MEISQASIKNAPVETKTKLADDLFRLLQVREKNQSMSKDWLLFLTTSAFSKLTPGEIYLAFKMAMGRELLDSTGKEFELLPELSNNTTGKVLTAYLKFKNEDSVYANAKHKLKQLALPDITEPSDEQKAVTREKFLFEVFQSLQQISDRKWRRANTDKRMFNLDAWLLYEELEDKLTVSNPVKKRLYARQLSRYKKELEREVAASGNRKFHREILERFQKMESKSGVVQNRCRSIVVSNYLRKHLNDFETFKNAINL